MDSHLLIAGDNTQKGVTVPNKTNNRKTTIDEDLDCTVPRDQHGQQTPATDEGAG